MLKVYSFGFGLGFGLGNIQDLVSVLVRSRCSDMYVLVVSIVSVLWDKQKICAQTNTTFLATNKFNTKETLIWKTLSCNCPICF
jgi:hypothetical protein